MAPPPVTDQQKTLAGIMVRICHIDTDEATLSTDVKSLLAFMSDEIQIKADMVTSSAWNKYITDSNIVAWSTHAEFTTWPTIGYGEATGPYVELLEKALTRAPEQRPRVRRAFEATTDLSNEGEI